MAAIFACRQLYCGVRQSCGWPRQIAVRQWEVLHEIGSASALQMAASKASGALYPPLMKIRSSLFTCLSGGSIFLSVLANVPTNWAVALSSLVHPHLGLRTAGGFVNCDT